MLLFCSYICYSFIQTAYISFTFLMIFQQDNAKPLQQHGFIVEELNWPAFSLNLLGA